MGTPKPVLGYPSRTEAAMALKAQGLGYPEIAARIGTTARNVPRLLSAGRLTRKRRPEDEAYFQVFVPMAVIDALSIPAKRRGMLPPALARAIIEAVVEDRLVDAVMDDAHELGLA
jgi:hypothetical protein